MIDQTSTGQETMVQQPSFQSSSQTQPLQPPQIQPSQPQANPPVAFQLKPAGFWIRFFAFLFDGVITSLIFIAISVTLFSTLKISSNSFLVNSLTLIIGAFYLIIFWVKDGATPGKKLFGLKIVKENHSSENLPTGGISFLTAIIRYIGYLISDVIIFLGFIWIAFDKNKRGWHDKLAGTSVVRLDDKNRVGWRI